VRGAVFHSSATLAVRPASYIGTGPPAYSQGVLSEPRAPVRRPAGGGPRGTGNRPIFSQARGRQDGTCFQRARFGATTGLPLQGLIRAPRSSATAQGPRAFGRGCSTAAAEPEPQAGERAHASFFSLLTWNEPLPTLGDTSSFWGCWLLQATTARPTAGVHPSNVFKRAPAG